MKKFKRSAFALNAIAVLVASNMAMTSQSFAAEAADAAEEEEKETIVVTGSRLQRTDVEGAAPVTVITAEDIEAQGFTTVFEALGSLTQINGSNQGAQDGGTFTQGADSLNLRSVGPGRTLTLLNGRRLADYPLPFNGQSNITNVANIPSVMVERIEVLASGASAIYGSDAVAGVVNIILKDEFDGLEASLRLGDTWDGGGESARLQLVGGADGDNYNFVYGLEFFKREPIMAFERDFMDSFNDNPLVRAGLRNAVNSRSFLILDPFRTTGPTSYVDPGEATCDPLLGLAGGSIEYSFRPGSGYYCGTANDIGFSSIRNAKTNYTAFVNGTYSLNDSHELFTTLAYTDSETEFDVGTNFWQYETGLPTNTLGRYFLNNADPSLDVFGIGGRPELWQRIFTPEEVSDNNNHSFEESFDITVGARGEFFAGFDYEAAISFSQYDLVRERRLIDKASADQFFVGDIVGTSDFGFGVWNIHNAPASNLYRQLTHAEYESISGIDQTNANSENMTANVVFTNSDLFEMPAGSAGLAVLLEAGSQEYDIALDPKLINREWFGFTGTGGGGERDRFAVGLEMALPLTDKLDLSTAVRWDKYDDETNVDDAITYNAGIQYRPMRDLLLRANYATSFRAPDMHFVYADPSGFFTSAGDQYLCRRDDLANSTVTLNDGTEVFSANNCNINQGAGGVAGGSPGIYGIGGARQGSTFLEEEEGESLTVGFVYNITEDMSVTVDYYDIELENVVRDQSISRLLETEANCRLGSTFAGVAVDGNSAECQNALSLVQRNIASDTIQSETISTVTTGPINASLRKVSGYDAAWNYNLSTEENGNWAFQVQYTITDEDEDQLFAGDEIRDLRSNLQYFGFRSQVNATVSWQYDDWAATVFATRTGSVPNWAETARCCTNVLINTSVGYQVTDDFRVLLAVRNLQNKNPQVDPTLTSYPYYFTGQYDGYGREYSLQFDYKIK